MSKKNYDYECSRECRITTKGNPEQTELARLIRDNKTAVIFGTGPAGTGKTFITIYTAYELVEQKKYERILYTRDAVQLGAEIGFIPGDISSKFDPFMACLFDNLEAIERLGGPTVSETKQKIDRTPVTFLRGRNLENVILIVDEAQNLDLVTLKAILTRISEHSKVILLGSMNQIDNKQQARKDKCDFIRVMEELQDLDFVNSVELTISKRSPYCALIDEKLKNLK